MDIVGRRYILITSESLRVNAIWSYFSAFGSFAMRSSLSYFRREKRLYMCHASTFKIIECCLSCENSFQGCSLFHILLNSRRERRRGRLRQPWMDRGIGVGVVVRPVKPRKTTRLARRVGRVKETTKSRSITGGIAKPARAC